VWVCSYITITSPRKVSGTSFAYRLQANPATLEILGELEKMVKPLSIAMETKTSCSSIHNWRRLRMRLPVLRQRAKLLFMKERDMDLALGLILKLRRLCN
jgi:hypothetical protein